MRSREPNAALLGLFWFGIQAVWGALLAISLQVRATQLAPHDALRLYGLLAGAGAALAAVTQIAAGMFSDLRRTHGSRRTEFYVTGALVACAGLFWFYLAPSIAQLVASLLLVQLAMNVAIGPYQAVIPDFVRDEDLGTASSWMAALQSLGNAAGAIAAFAISQARFVAAALAAMLLCTCAATVRHVRHLTPLQVTSEPLRLSRAFVDLFISRAFVYLGFYTLLGYLFFYVAATIGGSAKEMTGFVVLVVTLTGAIGAWLSAAPANRMDRRAVATAGGAGFITALAAFLISHSAVSIFASAAIAGGVWGVFLTADWALGCAFLPRFALATAMGIWNLALLIPQIAAPLIATAILSGLGIMQKSSAPRIAFVLAAVEVLAGIAWIWRLPASSRPAVESAFGGNTP